MCLKIGHIVNNPTRVLNPKRIRSALYACVILHNMIFDMFIFTHLFIIYFYSIFILFYLVFISFYLFLVIYLVYGYFVGFEI